MDSPLIPSEAKEKYIRPALVSGRLLFFMVSDILDYSLILANGLRLNYKPQSVLKTINDCFEIIQPKFIEKNLRLHLTLEGNIPPYTNTDHKRLSQILINLLNNSLQFTMKGEVEINVTRVSCGKLLISVKDTGIGMDKETQVKLESNLAKDYIDEKANHNSIGIGLGLFISNKLAKILNPDSQKGVKFVSSKNFGSTFYFEVKDYQQQRHDLSPKRLSGLEIEPHLNLNVKLRQYDTKKLKNCFRESLRGSGMNSLDKVQLLIVDDEIFNIIVLENFCKALGVKTEKALNGQEAIEKLKLSPKNSYSSIKVIFMDINMPIMDGYQATREIHNLVEKGEIEDVTVIGVTAYISWDKIEKGYRSGMTEILNKPVSKETILNVLTKYKIL